MKAIRIHQYGSLDVLRYEDIEIPTIQDDEVLVKVHAVGVNPIDWKIRSGYYREMSDPQLPLILGWDFSGEVVEIGKKVGTFKLGDSVFGMRPLKKQGTYTEYLAVAETHLSIKPSRLNYLQSASIPLASLTAWQALFDVGHLIPGQHILIHGAAGGVGHFAVQLAKWKGAMVSATASAKNKQYLLHLGVDHFVDYQTEAFEKQVRNVDIVFDTIGGEVQDRSWQTLRKKGKLITIVNSKNLQENAKKFNVEGRFLLVCPNAAGLIQIAFLVNHQNINPFLYKTFSLEEAAIAHQLSEGGHVRGKIALSVC